MNIRKLLKARPAEMATVKEIIRGAIPPQGVVMKTIKKYEDLPQPFDVRDFPKCWWDGNGVNVSEWMPYQGQKFGSNTAVQVVAVNGTLQKQFFFTKPTEERIGEISLNNIRWYRQARLNSDYVTDAESSEERARIQNYLRYLSGFKGLANIEFLGGDIVSINRDAPSRIQYVAAEIQELKN